MNTKNNHPNATRFSACLSLLAGLAAGWAGYYTDVQNVPLLAPAQDFCTGHLYQWAPLLQRLPAQDWFLASGVQAGLLVLVVCLLATSGSGSSAGKMERRIKDQVKRKREAHVAGFNV